MLIMTKSKSLVLAIAKHFLLPGGFYLLAFALLSYPLILDFPNRFFTDNLDGLMGVWNLWWVNTAITQPGVYSSIWRTNMLHWPFGTTLLGHTLAPFNGLLAVPLLRIMPMVPAHNVIVLFSFVASGLTAYWLSLHLTKSAWGSLAAGYIFTFSSYHFAHYNGHINLIALEWIPLFVLCWVVLTTKPTVWIATAAAICLWLVMLSDFYYLFYCLLTAGLIVLWRMVDGKDYRFFMKAEFAAPFFVFGAMSLTLLGPVVFPFLYLSRQDPFLGGHDALEFSLDLFSFFIPGGLSRFGRFTGFFWQNLHGTLAESSVYLGWSVIILTASMWITRAHVDSEKRNQLSLWFAILGFFFVMALGPRLQIGGYVTGLPMPYALLEWFFPFLKITGVPVRMSIMVILSASVISAMALRQLLEHLPQRKIMLLGVLFLLLFDFLPAPLVSTSPDAPDYVKYLAELPADGGVLDIATPTTPLHLYYQTIHQKPLAFGYLARIPFSVYRQEKAIRDALETENYRSLLDDFRIRYIVTEEYILDDDPYLSVELLFKENGIRVYRLEIR